MDIFFALLLERHKVLGFIPHSLFTMLLCLRSPLFTPRLALEKCGHLYTGFLLHSLFCMQSVVHYNSSTPMIHKTSPAGRGITCWEGELTQPSWSCWSDLDTGGWCLRACTQCLAYAWGPVEGFRPSFPPCSAVVPSSCSNTHLR